MTKTTKTKGLKISLGIALLAFSSTSWGFCETYIGLGAGPQAGNFKQHSIVGRASPHDIITNFFVVQKTHYAAHGPFASIFAGVAYRFDDCYTRCKDLYLAAELNADARSLKFKSYNNEFIHSNFNHDKYKMNHDLGVCLLPGYLLTECTLFNARVGYVNGRFKIDSTDETVPNVHKNLSGFRYGVGIKQGITDCIAIRMDYSHITYKSFKLLGTDDPAFITKTTRISPFVHRFELGVVYDF